MKTEIWEIKADELHSDSGQSESDVYLRKAGEILKEGGLVAFPTETVYGLGGDALNPAAASRIYAAKGRPSDNPLIVHIAKMKDLEKIAAVIPKKAEKLAEAFWPGPLTIIFQKTAAVPFETTGGLDTVAVRMPSHPVALALIGAGGGYIAAPSANTSGRPSPTTAAHVREDLEGRISVILDGGEVAIGLESTIVDMTVDPPSILRPGYITKEMLEQTIGPVEIDPGLSPDSKEKPKAPGMKYRHYAPKAAMLIVEGDRCQVTDAILVRAGNAVQEGKKVGILATEETKDIYSSAEGLCHQGLVVLSPGSRQREEEIAQHLYGVLRSFDEAGVDEIYSESFAGMQLGQAIMNRLLKAAGHQLIQV